VYCVLRSDSNRNKPPTIKEGAAVLALAHSDIVRFLHSSNVFCGPSGCPLRARRQHRGVSPEYKQRWRLTHIRKPALGLRHTTSVN
jgi:hypothetical protein